MVHAELRCDTAASVLKFLKHLELTVIQAFISGGWYVVEVIGQLYDQINISLKMGFCFSVDSVLDLVLVFFHLPNALPEQMQCLCVVR